MNVLIGVGAQVKLARLLLRTDARTRSGDLRQFLEAAVTGGVDIVQIHEPGLEHEAELAALRTAWDVAARHRHLVMVSDSAALAADFGADTVWLSQAPDTAGLADFRAGLGRFTRLGSTARDAEDLHRLLGDPSIDFLLVAAGSDLDLVTTAAEVAPVDALDSKPWYAAGEFDADRLEQAIAAGARRIAVGETLTLAEDPHRMALRLSQRLREVWATDPELTRLTFAALADQS
ncbi:thiamine phosphate synthase [Microlunatus endophyticus]|uniref:thiamine phosphate synthase n=1 Tax=Microlunatus endophyticus TaxID=1716077 RepID=UPI00166F536F|nr:thiamine phosphate synthase [Microlunatus endophyticus]